MSEIEWSDWIKWKGDHQPVHDSVTVSVELMDGRIRVGKPIDFIWCQDGGVDDVIRYRYNISEAIMGQKDEDDLDECYEIDAEEHDNVNHPPHYQLRPGYEVYDLRQDLARKAEAVSVPLDEYSDWDRVLEYLLRMWDKNMLEDAKKGRWYLDKLIEKLESRGL